MDLDPVLLSRLQFAWVIGWHILLPAFTVGMASYIAIQAGPITPSFGTKRTCQSCRSMSALRSEADDITEIRLEGSKRAAYGRAAEGG